MSDQQGLGWSGEILYEVSGASNRVGRICRIWVNEGLWLGKKKRGFPGEGAM